MRLHAFAATIAVGAVLLTSCSPGDDDSRPGVVSEASYTGLEVRRPFGVDFPGLAEPVKLDVAAYDLSWGPTGMEIDLFRSDFGSSANGSFPEEFGKVSGTSNIRMTVTC